MKSTRTSRAAGAPSCSSSSFSGPGGCGLAEFAGGPHFAGKPGRCSGAGCWSGVFCGPLVEIAVRSIGGYGRVAGAGVAQRPPRLRAAGPQLVVVLLNLNQDRCSLTTRTRSWQRWSPSSGRKLCKQPGGTRRGRTGSWLRPWSDRFPINASVWT